MTESRPAPQALRRLLLDAARALLREPDTRLDLRKVAERAGKSRTAPYLVFGKERDGGGLAALRLAVAADGAGELSRLMEEASLTSRDPLEAFRAVAEAVLAFSEENPRLFLLVFGSGARSLAGLGEEGFPDHPEFEAFLEGRQRAERVVTDLVRASEQRGIIPGDADAAEEGADAGPSGRSTGTAWAIMIGVAVLRQDELLQGGRSGTSREEGARRITEAVFGVDPAMVEDAWQALRRARGPGSLPKPAPRPVPRPSAPAARPPVSGSGTKTPARDRPAAASERPGGEWLPGLLKDLVPMNNPTAAAREILKRLDITGGGDEEEAGEDEVQPDADIPREGGTVVGSEAESGTDYGVSPSPGQGPTLTRVLRSHSGLRRAAQEARRLQGVPVLWVDGQPEDRDAEAELLRTLGLHLVRALNVEEAFRRIDRQKSSPLGPFRAILSDLSRGSRWRPGTETVSRLSKTAPNTPIIVYVPALEGTIGVPKGAVGITDSPDELLHLLLDAVGRGTSLGRA
jgi:AcrR family transcriptional regulator/CheY-like chemotaxis protein